MLSTNYADGTGIGNDEIQMTNDEGMTNSKTRQHASFFVILSLFRASSFVLRHFS
jgi:hypothetical protein